MDVNVIGVPIMYGSDRDGVQYGPDKMRQLGILDVISKNVNNLYDLGNLSVPYVPPMDKFKDHKKVKYFKPILEANKNLAHLVYSSLATNSFPFVIGGDHILGLGSISGASKYFENMAVIWIDAHGDINTPETSPSANAHGMPLAAAMGIGDKAMVDIYFEGAKIKPENVYVLGARDLDKGEETLAEKLNLNLYTMEKIRQMGLGAVIKEVLEKIKSSSIDGVHLSFDIDVLDKSIVPGTGTPVENGFSLEEGKKILQDFLTTGLIKSMDLVELNPYLDKGDKTGEICIELAEWTFKCLKLASTN